MLHEGLLGVLGSDPAKPGGRYFHFNFITELGIGFDPARVKHGNLIVLGKNFVGDDEFGKGLDIAGFWIDGAAEFAGRADRFLGGRDQGLFHGGDKDITADTFFPLPIF